MIKEKTSITEKNLKLRTQLFDESMHVRKLHNQIQYLKGNIRVFRLVRPPSIKRQEKRIDQTILEYSDDKYGS